MIDMVVGHILVWDSLVAMTLDAKLVNELNSMQIELPALLERVEILTTKPKLPVTPWRLFQVNITPQQIEEVTVGCFVPNSLNMM